MLVTDYTKETNRTPLGTGPIALKAYADTAPVYLPALQNLPGRIEFLVKQVPNPHCPPDLVLYVPRPVQMRLQLNRGQEKHT